MPTNQQRREAAKRKLQRQLVRREEQRARRKRTTLIVGSVAVLLIAAGVVLAITTSNKEADTAAGDPTASSSVDETAPTSSEGPVAPCTYTAGGTAAKKVELPGNTSPEQTGKVAATISLNGETVDVSLDRSLAPCSVSSFLSLASQGFYDNTTCTRLTKSGALNVLQCGDPSGKGNGGPGYSYEPTAPTADKPYPAGTLAMANVSSSQTAAEEGSQFFIVYGTTQIPASYSVIGTVSAAGMKVVDAITSQGVKDDRQDGVPNAEAKIESIKVPEAAVTASTVWSTPSSADPNSGANDSTGAVPSGSASTSGSDGSATSGAASTTGAQSSGAVSTGESSSAGQTTTN
ncbi:MAG: peptidylprolyl isomerase [Nakamurella sp.]